MKYLFLILSLLIGANSFANTESDKCEELVNKRYEVFLKRERNNEDVHEYEVLYESAKDEASIAGIDSSNFVKFIKGDDFQKTIQTLVDGARGDVSYIFALTKMDKMASNVDLDWSYLENSLSLGQVAVINTKMRYDIALAKDIVLSRMLDDYSDRVDKTCGLNY